MIIISLAIVIFILVLGWGKISIDSLNNNPRYSVFKTIIYLFLSIILCFIYYQTSTVTTNINQIAIKKLNGTFDKDSTNIDVAEVCFNNRMHIDKIGDYLTREDYLTKGGFEVIVYPYKVDGFTQYDSTSILTIYRILNEYNKVNNRDHSIPESNLAKDIIVKYLEEYNVFRKDDLPLVIEKAFDRKEKLSKADSTVLIQCLNYILKDNKLLYDVTFVSSSNPSFLPYETYKNDSTYFCDTEKNQLCLILTSKVKGYNHPTLGELSSKFFLKELNLWNANYTEFVVADNRRKGVPLFKVYTKDSLTNHIDYFTAADMSQAIYNISVDSDIPLRNLYITFDEPFSVSSINPQPDTISRFAISYNDSSKLQYVRNHPIEFHVKYPTYENKQLLRSLILTTVLVGVISLFCINALLFMTNCLNYLKNNSFLNRKKKLISFIKKFIRWIGFVFVCFVFVLYLFDILGEPFLISENDEIFIIDILKYVICIAGFIFFIMIVWLLSKSVYIFFKGFKNKK